MIESSSSHAKIFSKYLLDFDVEKKENQMWEEVIYMVIKTEKPNMLGIKVLWLLQAFRCCLSLFTNARRHLSRDILCRPYFQEKIADLYTFVALVITASAFDV